MNYKRSLLRYRLDGQNYSQFKNNNNENNKETFFIFINGCFVWIIRIIFYDRKRLCIDLWTSYFRSGCVLYRKKLTVLILVQAQITNILKHTIMKTTTTFVDDKEIEIYHADEITSGYGHKRITVELLYKDEFKKFTATTNNMPACDAATELEGEDKYHALYEIIKTQINDQVVAWLDN